MMTVTKAICNHHPVFLKQAYKGDVVQLVDHERHLSTGDRYIKFDPARLRFKVMVHATDYEYLVGSYDNLASAINKARRT